MRGETRVVASVDTKSGKTQIVAASSAESRGFHFTSRRRDGICGGDARQPDVCFEEYAEFVNREFAAFRFNRAQKTVGGVEGREQFARRTFCSGKVCVVCGLVFSEKS